MEISAKRIFKGMRVLLDKIDSAAPRTFPKKGTGIAVFGNRANAASNIANPHKIVKAALVYCRRGATNAKLDLVVLRLRGENLWGRR